MKSRAIISFLPMIVTLATLACEPVQPENNEPTPPPAGDPGNGGNPGGENPPPPPPPPPPAVCTAEIDINKQLFIKDLAVVNNSRTKFVSQDESQSHWSFIHLMGQLKPANMDMQAFIEAWLNQWKTQTEVNGFAVKTRANINTVLSDWPKTASGRLDLERAPFRLLGVVFRPDLRDVPKQIAGEGRFVFGVLDSKGATRPFTVILEYALPISETMSQDSWYQKILDLKKHTSFNDAYLGELQALTDLFTENRFASITNENAYVRVRTNEIALANPWELRHFEPTAAGLVQKATAVTPDLSFNGDRSDELISWLNDNRESVLAGTHNLPTEFMAGSAPTNPGFRWLFNKGVDEDLRKAFSINTCNGCHSGETNTAFLHVNTRAQNEEARLSDFLNGDLERRKTDFLSQLSTICKE